MPVGRNSRLRIQGSAVFVATDSALLVASLRATSRERKRFFGNLPIVGRIDPMLEAICLLGTLGEAVESLQTNESEPHGFWDRVRRFWSG